MRKRSGSFIIAALTLGLCLVAAQASARDFTITNSSGGTIQARCTNVSSTDDIANGATADYDCGNNALFVRAAGGNSAYSIPDDCPSSQVKSITVTAGANAGELNFAHQCVDA